MQHKKIQILTDTGKAVEAQVPIIISASRATDIPAFYGDWFINRLKAGYLRWQNPFNGKPLYVSFEKARAFVFWSKNPKPFIKQLQFIEDQNINFYFQFTLTDYNKQLETKVPPLEKRIETFIELSERIGKEKVIWRFDPYILTPEHGVDELLKKTEYIGERLKDYTNKLVFSFADMAAYRKVKANMNAVNYSEFTEEQMKKLAAGLQEINKSWNLELASCAEEIDLNEFGITHNKCIDDDLLIKLFCRDQALMDFLGVKIQQPDLFSNERKILKTKKLKDKGQRYLCGCVVSKDIGQYNTCPHGCIYCYANTSLEKAKTNFRQHLKNPKGENISGNKL